MGKQGEELEVVEAAEGHLGAAPAAAGGGAAAPAVLGAAQGMAAVGGAAPAAEAAAQAAAPSGAASSAVRAGGRYPIAAVREATVAALEAQALQDGAAVGWHTLGNTSNVQAQAVWSRCVLGLNGHLKRASCRGLVEGIKSGVLPQAALMLATNGQPGRRSRREEDRAAVQAAQYQLCGYFVGLFGSKVPSCGPEGASVVPSLIMVYSPRVTIEDFSGIGPAGMVHVWLSEQDLSVVEGHFSGLRANWLQGGQSAAAMEAGIQDPDSVHWGYGRCCYGPIGAPDCRNIRWWPVYA